MYTGEANTAYALHACCTWLMALLLLEQMKLEFVEFLKLFLAVLQLDTRLYMYCARMC